jgi:4-hydroxythreonine-4-phosphate dehydrogenase
VFGDSSVLLRVAQACGLDATSRIVGPEEWSERRARGEITFDVGTVVDCRAMDSVQLEPGLVQAACGRAAYAYVKGCAQGVIEGHVAAMATAPISKKALQLAGIDYPGHTEMLADLTGATRVCMMLASEDLIVSLVTIHMAFARVPGQLSADRILEVIELTVEAMHRLGKPWPRIAVCGLNPHAGEHGLFGREEEQAIRPAIEQACSRGLAVQGPLPPDTAFLPEKRATVDAYIVMYHDQGLIPFKMLAFDTGVNITLGLPIVRTSVDHGTAFDIAWQGTASPNSMIQAVLWAVDMSRESDDGK